MRIHSGFAPGIHVLALRNELPTRAGFGRLYGRRGNGAAGGASTGMSLGGRTCRDGAAFEPGCARVYARGQFVAAAFFGGPVANCNQLRIMDGRNDYALSQLDHGAVLARGTAATHG